MNEYRDHVTGCFAHRDEAGAASDALVQRGLPRARIQVFKHEEAPALDRAGSNAALKSMLADGAIGAAVGTGLGAEKKDGPPSARTTDAIASGLVVLIAETRSETGTAVAREVVQEAVRTVKDVSIV